MNIYKARVTKEKYIVKSVEDRIVYFICEQNSYKSRTFANRIEFYKEYIYDENLGKFDIKKLRKELDFEKNDSENLKRDLSIIKAMKFFTKDECAACKDRYDFKDRSFVTKKGWYYSEIHHFISLGKNKSLDLIENLTKLCPVCHRALGSGASDEKYQKMLIKKYNEK
ncbi:MAG: HNH endonuclease [Campylobacter sp.]|nr:HNH endonuclease [Campylobacter sp.]